MNGPVDFIIVGFGVPGRQVAEALRAENRTFRVIELNPKTVASCAAIGVRIIAGDATQPETLQRAGIDIAGCLVIAVPNDEIALEILRAAKRLNPSLRAVVRCNFSSTGIQAHRSGATEVVVAEQVVGEHLTRAILHEHQSNGASGVL